MLILMYTFILFALIKYIYCQVDADVDNEQRRELVNIFMGYSST